MMEPQSRVDRVDILLNKQRELCFMFDGQVRDDTASVEFDRDTRVLSVMYGDGAIERLLEVLDDDLYSALTTNKEALAVRTTMEEGPIDEWTIRIHCRD